MSCCLFGVHHCETVLFEIPVDVYMCILYEGDKALCTGRFVRLLSSQCQVDLASVVPYQVRGL